MIDWLIDLFDEEVIGSWSEFILQVRSIRAREVCWYGGMLVFLHGVLYLVGLCCIIASPSWNASLCGALAFDVWQTTNLMGSEFWSV